MRKKVVVVIFALVCVSSVAALGSSNIFIDNLLPAVKSFSVSNIFSASKKEEDTAVKTNIERKNQTAEHSNKSVEAAQNVPDKIVYLILFNHLVGLKQQAEKAQAKGEPALDYFNLYRRQANLDVSQSEFLFQTAQDCMNAVSPIDEQAKSVIDAARANFPNGEVAAPENIPPPPAELIQLQQQKDDTVLYYRDVLQNFLGAEKFAEFDGFARQKIIPELKANALNTFPNKNEGEVK